MTEVMQQGDGCKQRVIFLLENPYSQPCFLSRQTHPAACTLNRIFPSACNDKRVAAGSIAHWHYCLSAALFPTSFTKIIGITLIAEKVIRTL
jgi:hypothetical protein